MARKRIFKNDVAWVECEEPNEPVRRVNSHVWSYTLVGQKTGRVFKFTKKSKQWYRAYRGGKS